MPRPASRPSLTLVRTYEKESPVSSPAPHNPPLEVRERAACMCDHGDVCSSFAPGHALHLIQSRLASATPSDWADAIVESADAATGVIVVRGAVGRARRSRMWSGAGAADEPRARRAGGAARALPRARCRARAFQRSAGLSPPAVPEPVEGPPTGRRQAIFIIMFLTAMQASMQAWHD